MVEAGVSPMCTSDRCISCLRTQLTFGLSILLVMLVVSGFYRKHEQALRMGLWYCASKFESQLS